MVKIAADLDQFPFDSIDGVQLQARRLFPINRHTEAKTRQAGLDRWYLVSFDTGTSLQQMALALAEDPRIVLVEYDAYLHAIEPVKADPHEQKRIRPLSQTAMPFNDPELPYQWHYYNDGSLGEQTQPGADINLFEAWKYCTGDPRIIVAVLDDGVMHTHEDLAANMWVNEAEAAGQPGIDDDGNGYVDDIHGFNFCDMTGILTWDKANDIGHATHVAGTIAAVTNNGKYVAGIAGGSGQGDGCRIMSCQIFSNNEATTTSNMIAALKYAADNGAVIANNSWSYSPGDHTSDQAYEQFESGFQAAVDYFTQYAGLDGLIDGGLVIFAAGNESYPQPSYPGAYYSTVCVTAMAADYTAAYYTNYGTGANICAPGGELIHGSIFAISSTSIGQWGYEYMQGTSMACPHVAGCAALGLSYALQQGKSFTLEEYRNLLLTSVHDINAYQVGTKPIFDYVTGTYIDIPLEPYQHQLGSGYMDAHLLLMQIEGTPCLYFAAGETSYLSLDEYFGSGSSSLTYLRAEMSPEDRDALGISTDPSFENGRLKIRCTRTGSARIRVTAIIGGQQVGGDEMGGMEVSREFELIVRTNVAGNGGWL